MFELIRFDEPRRACDLCKTVPASVRHLTASGTMFAVWCKDCALWGGIVVDIQRFERAIATCEGSTSVALKGFGKTENPIPTITVWYGGNVFTVTIAEQDVQGVAKTLTHGLEFILAYESPGDGGRT